MIKMLPHWVMTSPTPAFYDTESGSAIEQTARVYAKMSELIEDYNKFITEINKHITDYERGILESFDCFRSKIIETMNDYIATLDSKIKIQDMKIANQNEVIEEYDAKVNDAIAYFKTNVESSVHEIIDEMKASGEFDELVTNSINELNNKYTNLMARVGVLEKQRYMFVYDSYKESLTLELSGGAN